MSLHQQMLFSLQQTKDKGTLRSQESKGFKKPTKHGSATWISILKLETVERRRIIKSGGKGKINQCGQKGNWQSFDRTPPAYKSSPIFWRHFIGMRPWERKYLGQNRFSMQSHFRPHCYLACAVLPKLPLMVVALKPMLATKLALMFSKLGKLRLLYI